jgi:hypothetical protein
VEPQEYARRVADEQQELPQNPVQREQGEQQDSKDTSSSQGSLVEGEAVNSRGSIDLPIALRKGTSTATGRSMQRYGFNGHDINNYVSYESLSPSYRAFVASL